MMWGGFTVIHKFSLIHMPPNRPITINYMEIVYDGVLGSFLEEHKGICKVVLIKDGTLVHRNIVTKDWRENHDIEKIEWPVQSLDLNLIKNV